MFRCAHIVAHYRKTRFNVCLAARSGYNSARWVPGFVSAQLLHRILVFTQPDRQPKVGFVVTKWNAAPIARLALQSSGLLSWAPARHRLRGNRGLEPLIFSLLKQRLTRLGTSPPPRRGTARDSNPAFFHC